MYIVYLFYLVFHIGLTDVLIDVKNSKQFKQNSDCQDGEHT